MKKAFGENWRRKYKAQNSKKLKFIILAFYWI